MIDQIIALARSNPIASLAIILGGLLAADVKYDVGVREVAEDNDRWVAVLLGGFVAGVIFGRNGGLSTVVEWLWSLSPLFTGGII